MGGNMKFFLILTFDLNFTMTLISPKLIQHDLLLVSTVKQSLKLLTLGCQQTDTCTYSLSLGGEKSERKRRPLVNRLWSTQGGKTRRRKVSRYWWLRSFSPVASFILDNKANLQRPEKKPLTCGFILHNLAFFHPSKPVPHRRAWPFCLSVNDDTLKFLFIIHGDGALL